MFLSKLVPATQGLGREGTFSHCCSFTKVFNFRVGGEGEGGRTKSPDRSFLQFVSQALASLEMSMFLKISGPGDDALFRGWCHNSRFGDDNCILRNSRYANETR